MLRTFMEHQFGGDASAQCSMKPWIVLDNVHDFGVDQHLPSRVVGIVAAQT